MKFCIERIGKDWELRRWLPCRGFFWDHWETIGTYLCESDAIAAMKHQSSPTRSIKYYDEHGNEECDCY